MGGNDVCVSAGALDAATIACNSETTQAVVLNGPRDNR
jgi:hypothetical protein